jgi:hypothetical protein
MISSYWEGPADAAVVDGHVDPIGLWLSGFGLCGRVWETLRAGHRWPFVRNRMSSGFVVYWALVGADN